MNCVVLAAGLGTRLRGISDSKPLTPVAGRPLIEHVVRRAADAGASRFVVVTGHQAERLEPFLVAQTLPMIGRARTVFRCGREALASREMTCC